MSNYVPEFLDIDAGTQAAAAAAMNPSFVLNPPDDATENTDKKGNTYKRWSEPAVIDAAWRESTDKGLLIAVVQAKIRTGSKNGGSRVWARHMIHPQVLVGAADETTTAKYEFMNNRAINALTTLLNATDLAPDNGGISGKLLSMLFPVKNAPGASSPLKGKAVFVNLVDQPNNGDNAKTPRQTAVESYLPDDGEE